MSFSQAVFDVEDQIDQLFQGYNTHTPGVAVAIVKDGQTIFKKGYGIANLEYDIPIGDQTVFHVASVSKQFTAFAIYLLRDEGKLSLEDDIRKYIPEIPDYGNPIKVKHLLAHTSGLRDQWALLTLAGWRMDDVITTEQILNLVTKQEGLNFPSGTAFGYSNTGYTLLALIVERISGQSFAEFTKENIFQPLGMDHTLFYDDYRKIVNDRAYSYEKHDGGYWKKKLNYATVGATSLFTTVEDMAKWTANFTHPVIGSAELISEYNSISTLHNGDPVIWSAMPNDTTYHAKGQLHYIYKGQKVISHGGHDAGFRAAHARFSEHKLSIITLSNDEHYNIFANLMAIAEVFLGDDFIESDAISSTPQKPKVMEDFKNDLTNLIGDYRSEELSTNYSIQLKDDQLFLQHLRLGDILLVEEGENRFTGINAFPFEIKFTESESGIDGLEISNFGVINMRFVKVKKGM